MNVYSNEYFDGLTEGSRSSAEQIVPLLLSYVPANSVVDVGCGVGTWLSVFQSRGVRDVLGVDGHYIDPSQLKIPQETFLAHDLDRALSIDRRFDLALSVEVAEHLRAESAESFVESLTALAPVVAFSAAIPGQGGDQHINEQWPPYWIDKFQKRGYQKADVIRRAVWDDPKVEWWYAQNLFIFVAENQIGRYPDIWSAHDLGSVPDSIVHPRNLSQSVWREDTLKFCLRLSDALPKDGRVALIDDGRLGDVRLGKNQQWQPFVERNGKYWGRPSDDEHAIREIVKAKNDGCQFVAVAWTAFWWLDHYRGFSDFLREQSFDETRDEMLALYRLTS